MSCTGLFPKHEKKLQTHPVYDKIILSANRKQEAKHMRGGIQSKRILVAVIALLISACVLIISLAEVRMPEASGTTVKKDGDLTIDCSHMDQGYIMVKAKKSKKQLKVRVKTSGASLHYDLNGDGEWEVIPLQFGSGKYQIQLFRRVKDKKYSEEGKINLTVEMEDELSCFLYPNQYVNYSADSPCIIAACEMCDGMTDQAQIYRTICEFIKKNFVYDFIKSVSVKAGVLPDIDGCWQNKMGICQDLSALTVAMLRSQGIPARLMIGTLGANTYHAWVVAVVNGEEKFFDPTAELNASSKTETYTTERFY